MYMYACLHVCVCVHMQNVYHVHLYMYESVEGSSSVRIMEYVLPYINTYTFACARTTGSRPSVGGTNTRTRRLVLLGPQVILGP